MWLTSLVERLRSRREVAHPIRRRRQNRRLELECLRDRTVPALGTVGWISTGDPYDGPPPDPPVDSILPNPPIAGEVASFTLQDQWFSNAGWAEVYHRGTPALSFNDASHVINVVFVGPAPDGASDDMAPVWGLGGTLWDLSPGEWTLNGPMSSLSFTVGVSGVAVNVSDAAVTEGNTGTTTATFTASLSGPSADPVTVNWATSDGNAVAGLDYTAASGTLTFDPGVTSQTVTVSVNGDRLGEPDETFAVNLSGATNATVVDGRGVGTILDDEPRISINDVTRAEGQRGQTTLFTFTVSLSAAYDQPVTVSFRTADGTAKANDHDYVTQAGTLTFAPGETTKTITIAVTGDSKKEANEAFTVNLSGATNALIVDGTGLGTILNDD